MRIRDKEVCQTQKKETKGMCYELTQSYESIENNEDLTSKMLRPATPAVLKFQTGPTDSWMTTSLPDAKSTKVSKGIVSPEQDIQHSYSL